MKKKSLEEILSRTEWSNLPSPYSGVGQHLRWCHLKRNHSHSLILQIVCARSSRCLENWGLPLLFLLLLFRGGSSNRSTGSKGARVSAVKPQVRPHIPWGSPPTPEHLLLGQGRISPNTPRGARGQAHRFLQQSGVAAYLAVVPQFCAIRHAWRCFSSWNTAPHIIHSGMQLTCAPISVRICIVLLMHLHLLLSLYSPLWRIYFLSMRGGFLGISLCHAPGGKETPCLIESPAAEVGILSSLWMLRVLWESQDGFHWQGSLCFPEQFWIAVERWASGQGCECCFWVGLTGESRKDKRSIRMLV